MGYFKNQSSTSSVGGGDNLNRRSATKLEGAEELIANIRKALLTHKSTEVRRALSRGAKMVINAAKANVNIDDGGRLKKSIKILPKWRKDPSGLYIGPKVKMRFTKKTSQKVKDANPFYAHWIEYGTREHENHYQGKFVSGKKRVHTGARKFPYMRPAFDAFGQTAIKVAMEDLSKMIENGGGK